jgi:hypothetical protein
MFKGGEGRSSVLSNEVHTQLWIFNIGADVRGKSSIMTGF